jgi:hypothetical protein
MADSKCDKIPYVMKMRYGGKEGSLGWFLDTTNKMGAVVNFFDSKLEITDFLGKLKTTVNCDAPVPLPHLSLTHKFSAPAQKHMLWICERVVHCRDPFVPLILGTLRRDLGAHELASAWIFLRIRASHPLDVAWKGQPHVCASLSLTLN